MKTKLSLRRVIFAGVMAAVVYVVTLFKIPFLGSNVHFANAACLLSGMLFGPVVGGAAAGMGSALYDLLAGGYGVVDALITFVSKFAMAFVAGVIVYGIKADPKKYNVFRTIIGAVVGALTYVVLYMIKTFVFKKFVDGLSMDATWVAMVSKLIPSLINALFASIIAPIFYSAILPILVESGLIKDFEEEQPKKVKDKKEEQLSK